MLRDILYDLLCHAFPSSVPIGRYGGLLDTNGSGNAQGGEMDEGGGLRISEAAQRVKASVWTLRALERRGLFRARRDWAGARRYSEEDIQRLRVLLFPQAEGERPVR